MRERRLRDHLITTAAGLETELKWCTGNPNVTPDYMDAVNTALHAIRRLRRLRDKLYTVTY